jgi:hypothetical protein
MLMRISFALSSRPPVALVPSNQPQRSFLRAKTLRAPTGRVRPAVLRKAAVGTQIQRAAWETNNKRVASAACPRAAASPAFTSIVRQSCAVMLRYPQLGAPGRAWRPARVPTMVASSTSRSRAGSPVAAETWTRLDSASSNLLRQYTGRGVRERMVRGWREGGPFNCLASSCYSPNSPAQAQ